MTTYPLIPELRKLDALTLIGCTDWAREGFRRVIFQQREQYRWSMTAGPVAQTLTNLTKFLQKFENFTCKLLFKNLDILVSVGISKIYYVCPSCDSNREASDCEHPRSSKPKEASLSCSSELASGGLA